MATLTSKSKLEEIYDRIKTHVPALEWATMIPLIERIWQLKAEKKAVILAHNYQTPEIYYGVADFTGDSLALAQQAAGSSAEVIVMAGVHFMAETTKLLCPSATVLIPDARAGCSLAESISGADVRKLRAQYPGVPVVTYVNTSAEVKAESDICCTSGNALKVVESLGVPRVIFIPDQYLAANVARETGVEIITHPGSCMVHEQFTPGDLRELRVLNPGVTLVAHPECPPEVCDEADMSGSTAGMVEFLKRERPAKVALITECSMSDNLVSQFPQTEFIRPCNLCPHMKRITLQKIVRSLETMQVPVEIEPTLAARARTAVERMLAVGRQAGK
ncbi:MAG: quinolinate synthase NadA [Candidatus Eremiobacteraeota bacterium]|nr:quinolinate synthase NadA [Candidatus Eremiobacteraeota bacterium]MCW5870219.1 quinolinate synthase NadA [Candidatus Eremiobacteraeota bacterium]